MLVQPQNLPAWRKMILALVASRPGAWFFSRTLHHFDRAVLKLSGGKQTLTALLSGLQVVTLTTIGAKSGVQRSVPVIPLADGEKLVLMPTNFGQARHPGWYYNLRAHPEAWVTYRGVTIAYRAREATAEEALAYWQRAEQMYVGYKVYRQRAAHRQIGLFVLEPKGREGVQATR